MCSSSGSFHLRCVCCDCTGPIASCCCLCLCVGYAQVRTCLVTFYIPVYVLNLLAIVAYVSYPYPWCGIYATWLMRINSIPTRLSFLHVRHTTISAQEIEEATLPRQERRSAEQGQAAPAATEANPPDAASQFCNTIIIIIITSSSSSIRNSSSSSSSAGTKKRLL